jgi:RNA polymerase sigma-70 factor (ECF subfamily)
MPDLVDRLYLRIVVIRCQVGDRGALEELIGRLHPRLRGFLQKLLTGPGDVDDVAQDVWFDVFRGLPKLENVDSFLPWFYRIARNRAYRLLRRRKGHMESIERIDAVASEQPEDEFSAEDASRVYAALDRLTAEHREVLLLRFIEQMSYDDLARVTGCPIGTVRSRIHNAKRGLREILNREEQP